MLYVMVLDKGFVQESFELFVDRQRQAAVVLGERDIAGDVKAKRKRDRQAIPNKSLFPHKPYYNNLQSVCGGCSRVCDLPVPGYL